jgi:hypothetical protein
MDESEVRELQQMAWVIQGATRKLNEVTRSISATTDELKALREDLGIPPQPQLRLVDEQADDDG